MAIFRQMGVDFDLRRATIFLLIARQGPVAVQKIAERFGMTHPAVTQVINELEKKLIV